MAGKCYRKPAIITSYHSETADFINLLYANTLLPLISKPTKYGDHSATLIDNVITNMSSQNSLYGIILDDVYQSFCYLVMSKTTDLLHILQKEFAK